jgi:hypothetical protein
MFTIQKHTFRHQLAAAAALVVIGLTALPATARPDPGEPLDAPVATQETNCALARVGTQFVKCDDLTGNGVAAPATVPER